MKENRMKKRFSGLLTCAVVASAVQLPAAPIKAEVTPGGIEAAHNSIEQVTTTDSQIKVPSTTEAQIKVEYTTGPQIEAKWQENIFGSNMDGKPLTNNRIEKEGDTIKIFAEHGKVATDVDGLVFYNIPLQNEENFEISVKAKVSAYTSNGQASFGIMLRDSVTVDDLATDEISGTDAAKNVQGSKMIGVGALDKKMESFMRIAALKKMTAAEKVVLEDAEAAKGKEYTLNIKKSGNTYALTCNGKTAVVTQENLFSDKLYAGIYAARAVDVEFTGLNLEMRKADSLSLVEKPTKVNYLQGQALDLTGLVVEADGTEVPVEDLIIGGYNPSTIGTQTITISYGGQSQSFTVTVDELQCTDLSIGFTPAKTTYYLGDTLELDGLTVNAKFNSGEERQLKADEYTVSEVDLSIPGKKTLEITYNSKAAEGVKASFEIEVLADKLLGLEITKAPVKTTYYLGETLDLKGLLVKAVYENEKVLVTQKPEDAEHLTGYTVDASNFDTVTPGEKTVTIQFKDQVIDIKLEVKEKTATGIEVTTLPKTTYKIGEDFESNRLVVSKVYDSGEKTELPSDAYTIDASNFDSSKVGTYTITITPTDETLKPISFTVAVREPIEHEWKTIAFGQSISLEKNFVEKLGDDKVRLTALEGGGKITNSFQDGITFCYTEIDNAKDNFELSADIKIEAFAKPTPDNQEGFGIMARDAIGTDGDASVFYSNIAAVGGYRGATQMIMRSGVTASDSTGAANGKQDEIMMDKTRPSASTTNYRLTLKKTNTGYTGQLNNGTEVITYEPEALGTQDGKVYVGFYAARLATIEVSNVKFDVTDRASDAPKVEKPEAAINPMVTINSLSASSRTDYDLKVYANVDGMLTIKQGETIIARDVAVKGGETFVQPTTLAEQATTPFTVTFMPNTDQNLTSYDKIIRTMAVTMKTFGTENGAIYVSPNGVTTADGSKENPLDVATAINFVRDGQTVYMLEGTYTLNKAIGVQPGNNGSEHARKTLAAAPGAKVTIDANGQGGFNLDGDYWHIAGIDFTGARSTGFRIGGNHNIVELCNFYSNGDTGMQISRYGNGGYDTWPAYNLVLNCTSYDNIDASENNADGFAAKLTCGPGNVFKGCISHNNIDDAWDLFAKGSTGPIGAVTLEDCIAYGNGTLTDGYVGKGDKNGFKLGGEGIAVPHVIKNSIAFNNGATGFSSNSNPAVISENCVSYDNADANFDWRVYTDVEPQFKATGNVSYRSTPGAKDVYPESLVSNTNYYYDGTGSKNAKGTILKDKNFKSLEVPASYERDADGNIIFGDFLKFIAPNTSGGGSSDDDHAGSTGGGGTPTKPSDDEIIKDAIENGKVPTLTVGSDAKAEVAIDMVQALIGAHQDLVIKAQGVTIGLNPQFLNANVMKQEGIKTLEVKAAPMTDDKFKALQKELAGQTAIKVVGDTQLTVDLAISAATEMKHFNEPAVLTMDLSKVEVKEGTKLTLVRYEEQKDGTVKVIKLGGTYNKETKAFTGLVDGPGVYGIAEAESLLKVNLSIGNNTSIVNEEAIANDIAPQIIDDVTMVPLRFIAENLAAEVKWNGKTKEVTIMVDEEIITLKVDGKEAMIKEDRTLVPIRYISESLGANVLWIPSTKGVEIVK